MSDQRHSPENPFDRPGAAPHQYGERPPQRGASRVWLWVLGTIGILVVLAALVCCGGGYFAWQFGSEALAKAMIEELQGNPVIEEHIGEIERAEMNLQATAEEQENVPNSLTFDIEGPKGEGRLVVRQDPGAEKPSVSSAVLVLPDGTRHQVLGEPKEPPAEAPETAEPPQAETPEPETPEPAEAEPEAEPAGANP